MKNIHRIGVWLTCRLLDHFYGSSAVQRHIRKLRKERLQELSHAVLSLNSLNYNTPGLRE
jgi:hypothetical protein